MHVHVIPVPFGMTPEDAWAEITTLGRLAIPPANDAGCSWAVIECDGDECNDVEGELTGNEGTALRCPSCEAVIEHVEWSHQHNEVRRFGAKKPHHTVDIDKLICPKCGRVLIVI